MRRWPKLLGVAGLALAAAGGAAWKAGWLPIGGPPALAATIAPTLADVPYPAGGAAHDRQRIDVYHPAGAGAGGGPHPAVLWFHPGAFRFGSKDSVHPDVGKALLDAGYAIVAVGYRLSGDATFPAAFHDARAAVRFVRADAARLGIDPDRLAAWGASAGGNLAALVGTAGNAPVVMGEPGGAAGGGAAPVRAVIDWFGPHDFSAIDPMLRQQGCKASDINHDTADGFESLYLGAPLPQVPDKVRAANPVTYVDAGDPPFLLQYGDADCNIGSGQGALLQNALRAKGVVADLDVFPGTGHGGDAFSTPENIRRMIVFLDTHLKPARSAP